METLKMIKAMKQKNIYIGEDFICGSDDFYCTFSIIYSDCIEDEFKNTSFLLNDYLSYLKNNEKCPDHILKNPSVLYNMKSLKSKCLSNIYNNKIIMDIEDIRQYKPEKNYSFDELLKMKSADGMKFYILNQRIMMSTFNTIHPVNKSDKVSLKTYDMDQISFLSEFIIDKKKFKIQEFIRYRYLS